MKDIWKMPRNKPFLKLRLHYLTFKIPTAYELIKSWKCCVFFQSKFRSANRVNLILSIGIRFSVRFGGSVAPGKEVEEGSEVKSAKKGLAIFSAIFHPSKFQHHQPISGQPSTTVFILTLSLTLKNHKIFPIFLFLNRSKFRIRNFRIEWNLSDPIFDLATVTKKALEYRFFYHPSGWMSNLTAKTSCKIPKLLKSCQEGKFGTPSYFSKNSGSRKFRILIFRLLWPKPWIAEIVLYMVFPW